MSPIRTVLLAHTQHSQCTLQSKGPYANIHQQVPHKNAGVISRAYQMHGRIQLPPSPGEATPKPEPTNQFQAPKNTEQGVEYVHGVDGYLI
jgi:hypothetical protein